MYGIRDVYMLHQGHAMATETSQQSGKASVRRKWSFTAGRPGKRGWEETRSQGTVEEGIFLFLSAYVYIMHECMYMCYARVNTLAWVCVCVLETDLSSITLFLIYILRDSLIKATIPTQLLGGF